MRHRAAGRNFRTGDLALIYSSWTVTGTGADGPVVMTGESKAVLREQSDGMWKLTIDDPGWKASTPGSGFERLEVLGHEEP